MRVLLRILGFLLHGGAEGHAHHRYVTSALREQRRCHFSASSDLPRQLKPGTNAGRQEL